MQQPSFLSPDTDTHAWALSISPVSDTKSIVTNTQSSYLTQYRAEISISIRASVVQGQGFLCPQSDFEEGEMLFYILHCFTCVYHTLAS